jgi:hypothetical protein
MDLIFQKSHFSTKVDGFGFSCTFTIYIFLRFFNGMFLNTMLAPVYEGWSKSFRPDQLSKVTEIKQLGYFSI